MTGRAVEPLSIAHLRRLEEELARDKQGLLAIVRRVVGYPITEIEFRELIADARVALEHPEEYARLLSRREKLREDSCDPPADIPPYPGIDIEPCRRRYEKSDHRWATVCIPWLLKQKDGTLERPEFPEHGKAKSRYIYTMKSQAGTPLRAADTIRIALFSDFGTGEYQSQYMAKKIFEATPHYAVHLGDVYYAGLPDEVKRNLEEPLREMLDCSRVFAMNANHEMLSGGFGYFDYLKTKRDARSKVEQEQEGSYFCLTSELYQVVAIDTAYDYKNDGELTSRVQQEWLTERLRDAKDANPPRTTILLSQHEPFGLGETDRNPLFDQVAACAVRNGRWMIDYWFWGDEHYCALFQPSDKVPFVGSCIGHGGFPVDLQDVGRRVNVGRAFAKEQWAEQSPRFSKVRTDELGNTGYCILELGPGGVRLDYRSWLGNSLKTYP